MTDTTEETPIATPDGQPTAAFLEGTLPPTLAERIVEARRAMPDWIKKDAKNSHFKYSYLSEEAVKFEARQAFNVAGIAVLPDFEVIGEREYKTGKGATMHVYDVKCHLELRACGEVMRSTGLGSGADDADKGLMKAQTAAFREALKGLLIIPSGNDPERFDVDGAKAGGGGKEAPKGEAKRGDAKKETVDLSALKAARKSQALGGGELVALCKAMFGCGVTDLGAADVERLTDYVARLTGDALVEVQTGNIRNVPRYERAK